MNLLHSIARSSFQGFPCRVLSNSHAGLPDPEREILNFDYKARCYDLSAGFSVLRSHNVKRKAGAASTKQFDTVDAGDKFVGDRKGLYVALGSDEYWLAHAGNSPVLGRLSQKIQGTYKSSSLSHSTLSKIAHFAFESFRFCSRRVFLFALKRHRDSSRSALGRCEQSARQVREALGGQSQSSHRNSCRAVLRAREWRAPRASELLNFQSLSRA
jgi:hypothetical protein